MPDAGPKTILVTGAAAGIGRATAEALAAQGVRVVIGARSAERARDAAASIPGSEPLALDMASFASIRTASARLMEARPALDGLVNNAGIIRMDRRVGPDGHELTWTTNFLGAFLLTRLLTPALRRAASPRVVNVSSTAHRSGRLDWEDLELSRGYRGFQAYANTKLALVLFTREFARRHPEIAANAVHPGAIATDIWRPLPAPLHWILARTLLSAARGAQPVVRLAVSPDVEGVSGRYFDRLRESAPSAAARDDAAAARLWDLADRATGARDAAAIE